MSGSNRLRRHPLRKVMSRRSLKEAMAPGGGGADMAVHSYTVWIDKLECGHRIPTAYGGYRPVRRCPVCPKGAA